MSAPWVVLPGVVVPVGLVVLPGVVDDGPGVVVLPAPVAGGTLFVPGPLLLLHGAISADVFDVGGVVLFVPAPVVEPARDEEVDEPVPARDVELLVSVPARLVAVSLPLRVPVVPTADEPVDDVVPVALPLRAVSPVRVVVLLPAVLLLPVLPLPARAVAPVLVPALAESLTGTHGSALAFGPDVPGCVVVPDCVLLVPVVPAVPGALTPAVPLCVGLDVLVLCAWSGTISAAISSAPLADNVIRAFTWTFLSEVSY